MPLPFCRRRPASPDPYRPTYHCAPPSGWMNDPCGLVYADGRYHLYYQHFPGATFWGPMHWGHATSADLLHWRDEPVALAPDPELGMAFTGSAVLDRSVTPPRLAALLTHHGGALGGEKQSLATSPDGGKTWQIEPGNPVLPATGESPFRDPRVFRHEASGAWIMAIAAGPGVALYRSDDLRRWERSDHVLLDCDEDDGLWEVPELLRLPVEGEPDTEAWLLKVDRNRLQAAPSSSLYWTGDFDGRVFHVHDPKPRLVDHGRDFYAAQAWSEAPGDEPVWIGWMGNWAYSLVTPTRGWRGMMSLPRRLSLRRAGGALQLVQRPVPDQNVRFGAPRPLEGLRATAFSLELQAEVEEGRQLTLDLRAGQKERTTLRYDGRTLTLDRRHAGRSDFHRGFAETHSVPLPGPTVDLRVFVDHSSVEVFADDGAVVLSDRVFPSLASNDVRVWCTGQVLRLRACPA